MPIRPLYPAAPYRADHRTARAAIEALAGELLDVHAPRHRLGTDLRWREMISKTASGDNSGRLTRSTLQHRTGGLEDLRRCHLSVKRGAHLGRLAATPWRIVGRERRLILSAALTTRSSSSTVKPKLALAASRDFDRAPQSGAGRQRGFDDVGGSVAQINERKKEPQSLLNDISRSA